MAEKNPAGRRPRTSPPADRAPRARKPAPRPTTAERTSDRELVVTRTLNGPVALVYRAWTEADLFVRWWVPASFGLTLLSCTLDVREGGTYRLEFQVEGGTMVFFGTYLEVVPNTRLRWTNEEGDGSVVFTTVTFTERAGKTHVVVHDLYPSKEALDAALASGSTGALPEQLDQLDALLPELRTTSELRAGMSGRASGAKAAEGDAPVFAYLASLPEPQRTLAQRLDALAAEAVPGVRRAVKWGMAYYGVPDGWCFSVGGFVGHVKLAFIRGTELAPVPPVTPVGMGRATRCVEPAAVADVDEAQVSAWMRQAARLPFAGVKKTR